ncbi:transcription antitermination factor NusB [bacterium]|jgi:N utilization substance protein B|nr:transcription antitermination factor NusB [bacterium]
MKSRHLAREIALQILYEYDVGSFPTGVELDGAIHKHFEHFKVPEKLRDFAGELVRGTVQHREALDQTLEKHATHWKLSRMSVIDRNLLRMALYEMQNFKDIPASVSIDEAIELAKQFGSSESPSFINGILDAYHRENSAPGSSSKESE